MLGQPKSTTELLWDRDRAATATSGAYLLPAGRDTAWAPEVMLATAASASLLTTFIALARNAQVPLLGYVAQQRADLDESSDAVARITIAACISVPSDDAAARARAVWTVARHEAPLLRILNCPVICESNVVVLSDAAVECDG